MSEEAMVMMGAVINMIGRTLEQKGLCPAEQWAATLAELAVTMSPAGCDQELPSSELDDTGSGEGRGRRQGQGAEAELIAARRRSAPFARHGITYSDLVLRFSPNWRDAEPFASVFGCGARPDWRDPVARCEGFGH